MDFTKIMKVFNESADIFIGQLGIKMDYSKKSLFAVEDLINNVFPKAGRPQSATTIVPFGYYLGETLVRSFPNAEWMMEAVDVWDLEVKITIKDEQYIKIKPFTRANKFFMDRTDSLVAMYELVEHQLSGGIDFENAKVGPEWIRKGNLSYRVIGMEEKKHDDKK